LEGKEDVYPRKAKKVWCKLHEPFNIDFKFKFKRSRKTAVKLKGTHIFAELFLLESKSLVIIRICLKKIIQKRQKSRYCRVISKDLQHKNLFLFWKTFIAELIS
jgi:hypothetical protein